MAKASASVALVVMPAEFHAEVDDRLGDLGADAADDALGPHQPGGRHRLQQVLCRERVHRRHARDVDDRDARAGLDDPLEERFHDDLGAGAVEGADHRQGEDALPELDDRRRELEHLLLLAADHFLARLLVDLGRVEAQLVQQFGDGPALVGQGLAVPGGLAEEPGEQGLLEGEHEGRRLRGAEALEAARAGKATQHAPDILPLGRPNVVQLTRLGGRSEEGEEFAALLAQLPFLQLARVPP